MPVDHNTDCAICQSNFYDEFTQHGADFNGEVIAEVAPCGHYFHLSCVQTWFDQPQGNQLCPVCREELGGHTDITSDVHDDWYQAAHGHMLDD